MASHTIQDISLLQSEWKDVSKACSLSPVLAENWWTTIQEKYSESTRHYHTLMHLQEMFEHFEAFRDKIGQPTEVSLAIFFHDIVYDPKAPDNEEQSITLFEAFSSEATLNPKSRQKVVDMIRATITHKTDDLNEDSDDAFFLDFDMGVLGRTQAGYQEYASQIRQEYIHVPEDEFKIRRVQVRMSQMKVLKNFLKREKIYASRQFRNLYEEIARQNLMEEIETLEGGP